MTFLVQKASPRVINQPACRASNTDTACLISVAEGSFFPACLNPTVATSWSLHVNSTHTRKQLGSLSKCWHSQPSPWSPAQAQKLSAVQSLLYGALSSVIEPRSGYPEESQVKLVARKRFCWYTSTPDFRVSILPAEQN